MATRGVKAGPGVSIITVSFNSAETIGDAIQSVNAQTYSQIEHIVIDGGSTDGTMDVVSRVKVRPGAVLSEPDSGIYDAMNKGARRASGEIVGFLNSDDILSNENAIADIVREFEEAESDVVYGDLNYVSRRDPSRVIRMWRAGQFNRRGLLAGWMPPHPTFYLRASLLRSVGYFDESFRIAADYELMLRCLLREGVSVRYVPKTLVFMKTGGASNHGARQIWRKMEEDLRAIRMHGLWGIATLIMKNARKMPQFL